MRKWRKPQINSESKSTYLSLCHLVVVVREGQIATPGVDVHVVP